MVRDVQTNEVYEFICNKWLAQEKGDELVTGISHEKINNLFICYAY